MEGACLNRFPFHFVSEIPASAGMTMEGTGMTRDGKDDNEGAGMTRDGKDDNEGTRTTMRERKSY